MNWTRSHWLGVIIDDRVPEKTGDNTRRSPLRAFYDWVKGGPPAAGAAPEEAENGNASVPARIGHYVISRKLGQGGMGVVYEARDERLQRAVAVKTMSSLASDETARKRFWREARAAASVNHPNICQIYEIGEGPYGLFIAMELLEGEGLSERLRRGPMSVSDAMPTALGILAALSALHARGIVHRDLKPSNVFLTAHGVKLLDFGLARPEIEQANNTMTELTGAGMVLGTPRYMAPEQATGDAVDTRTDLFSAGAMIFEMLAGRPAFNGATAVAILHATLHEQPPALTGSAAVAAVDRVIRRALSKRPADRQASADHMAAELRAIGGADADDTPAVAHALTRLVVLPFRVLRADPETDFLAFSLPDAISTSLSGRGSLIVRSSATAARFANEIPDFKVLAAEADVDRVVTGSLLRSGDNLRVTVQLVEAPGGTLLASHSVQSSLGDLFRLQDDIAGKVTDALALPLGGTTTALPADVPQNARAYELYLRANEVGSRYYRLDDAAELYRQCLELDPNFAPAWAMLGRCYRLIGKFVREFPEANTLAEEAYRRALVINPRLSIAHKYYANLEADTGHGRRGLERLMGEATRRPNDPELFAGLVHACRYCGLFEESLAAHAEARRLDPHVPTSVEQTLLFAGEIDRLVTRNRVDSRQFSDGDDAIRVVGLGLAGRRDEAFELLEQIKQQPIPVAAFKAWVGFLEAWLHGRPAEMLERIAGIGALAIHADPEAVFEQGWMFAQAGDLETGLACVKRGVERGCSPALTMAASPHFDPLRQDPVFQEVLNIAETRRAQAKAAFREAGGDRLLGL